MQEMKQTWVWFLSWEDPLEEEMATHFSILTWKILWTKEPGGLQSKRQLRVGYGVTNKLLSNKLLLISSFCLMVLHSEGFPGGSDGRESAYNAGDPGLIPGQGRSPGEGNATPSCILAWRILWTQEPGVWGCKELDTTERLSHS